MRGEIEDAFDMHAVDIYGLSEVMGPGVANECVETKDGLHIWEDHFYPEVIDPETGAVLPDGAAGRAGVHLAHQGGDAGRSATAPATSRACCPAPHAPCGGWRRSPAAATT